MQKGPCSYSSNRYLVYARLCNFTAILEVSDIWAQKNPVTTCNLPWLNRLTRCWLNLDGSVFKVSTPFPNGYILSGVGFVPSLLRAPLSEVGRVEQYRTLLD